MSHHLEALDRAREVTRLRTGFKRELKAGETKLSEILWDGIPDWLGSMCAEALLLTAPRVGHAAAFSLLQEAQLGPMQEARNITERQRLLLAVEMEKIEGLRR